MYSPLQWVCLTALVCVANGAEPAAPAFKASVRGRIVGETSKSPIAQARVTLRPLGDTTEALALRDGLTDESGSFLFEGVAPGSYQVLATHPRLVSLESLGPIRGRAVPLLRIEAEGESRVTCELLEKARLRGRVSLENGRPAGGAKVVAVVLDRIDGLAMRTIVQEAEADENGRYLLDDLRPGSYVVQGSLRSAQSSSALPLNYSGTTAGTMSLLDGAPLLISAGEHVADFTLNRDHGFRISGTNRSSPGGRTEVFLIPADATGNGLDAFPSSGDADGHFEFAAISAGSYELVAVQRTQEGTIQEIARQEVMVRDRDVGDVKLVLQSTGTVSISTGLVSGSTEKIAGKIRVYLTPAERPLLSIGAMYQQEIGSEGQITLTGIVPGRYRIEFQAAGKRAASLVIYGREVGAGDVFNVPWGASVPVSVTMASGMRVTGKVLAGSSVPVGAVILLFPSGGDAASVAYDSAEVDQLGRWEIKGVLPGSYQVVAVDSLVPQNSTDVLLRQVLLRLGGKAVEVKANSVTPVDDIVVRRLTE